MDLVFRAEIKATKSEAVVGSENVCEILFKVNLSVAGWRKAHLSSGEEHSWCLTYLNATLLHRNRRCFRENSHCVSED